MKIYNIYSGSFRILCIYHSKFRKSQNVLSDGRISLYLESYLGREETPVLDDNGNPVLYETGKMGG